MKDLHIFLFFSLLCILSERVILNVYLLDWTPQQAQMFHVSMALIYLCKSLNNMITCFQVQKYQKILQIVFALKF